MDADDIEAVVVTELELELNCEHTQHTCEKADDDRRHPTNKPCTWRDGHKSSHGTRGSAECGRFAVLDALKQQPSEHSRRCCEEGVHECGCSNAIRSECGTSVETEPTEPQNAGSQKGEGKVVRMHSFTRPSLALSKNDDHCECSRTSVDVHNRTTGEVEGAELGQPATAEDPVRHGGVDKDKPQRNEDAVGLELESVSSRSGDKRRSDDRECHLIGAEQHERDRESKRFIPCRCGDVAHPSEVKVADEAPVTEVAERQGEGDGHPDDGHEAHGKEVLHEHAEHILRPDHAAVEKRQTWSHEQHQAGRNQHPRCVTGIDLCSNHRCSLRCSFTPDRRKVCERMPTGCFVSIP
ncbi:unannotated protein [freshwater metagenome]|uniref:Unannotated protein n=1 Tax=freshwater metagenome TaxID=449393 RepID=A0A6J6DA37_9ZZZZ